jgi:hypothetical protein
MNPQLYNPEKRKTQNTLLYGMLKNARMSGNSKLSILCLPGSTGHDAWFFLAQSGVGKIICLEEDRVIYEHLKKMFNAHPKVQIFNETVQNYLSKTEQVFDLIYLDFFSYFSENIKSFLEVLLYRKKIKENMQIAFAFLAARESVSRQIMQEIEVANLFEALKQEKPLKIEKDTQRALCVNSFFYFLNRKTTYKIGGMKWFKYDTETAAMLTVSFDLSVEYREKVIKWTRINFNEFLGQEKAPTKAALYDFAREKRIAVPTSMGTLSYYLTPEERSLRIKVGQKKSKAPTGRPRSIDWEKVLLLRKNNMSLGKIALNLSVSKSAVSKIVSKNLRGNP